MFLYWKKE